MKQFVPLAEEEFIECVDNGHIYIKRPRWYKNKLRRKEGKRGLRAGLGNRNNRNFNRLATG